MLSFQRTKSVQKESERGKHATRNQFGGNEEKEKITDDDGKSTRTRKNAALLAGEKRHMQCSAAQEELCS